MDNGTIAPIGIGVAGAVGPHGETMQAIYVVCNDGSFWHFIPEASNRGFSGWRELAPVPGSRAASAKEAEPQGT
jgi:hypothetical protein